MKPEELRPGEQCAQEWCAKFGQQLHSQKDTLQIQEALPDTNLQKFTGKLGLAACRLAWTQLYMSPLGQMVPCKA